MNKFLKAFKHPDLIPRYLWKKASPLIRNDEFYLRINYLLDRKRILHLKKPIRFNEKLQWLKLNIHKPERCNMVDKYECKKIIAKKIGEQYVIPTLGVWDDFDEIDFNKLPEKFVLKCTHDSYGLVICQNRDTFDLKRARKKIKKCLARNYFYRHREFEYKNLKPRIIAEEYMVDESGWQLKDYKVFCFNGEPKFIEVDYDRYLLHKLNVYDLQWNYIDFYMTSHNDPNVHIPKPKKLDKMIEIAKELSKDDIFVRVDFYSIDDKIYIGELTYYPGGGCIDFHPDKYDIILGNYLKLPIDK